MTHRQSGFTAAFCFLFMAALIAIAVTACAPAPLPQPTPQIIEVPGPQPTPQIIEVPGPTIAITPQVCVEALNGLDVALQAENDMLMRYYEGKEPTEAQWDAFLDLDPESIYDAVTQCLASTDAGS